jgi:hypothetical protein
VRSPKKVIHESRKVFVYIGVNLSCIVNLLGTSKAIQLQGDFPHIFVLVQISPRLAALEKVAMHVPKLANTIFFPFTKSRVPYPWPVDIQAVNADPPSLVVSFFPGNDRINNLVDQYHVKRLASDTVADKIEQTLTSTCLTNKLEGSEVDSTSV